jgi:hypothetical protein
MYYYYDAPVAIAHPNLRGHSRFDELYVRGGYDFDSVRFFVSLLTQANKGQTTVTVNQILTQKWFLFQNMKDSSLNFTLVTVFSITENGHTALLPS